MGDDLRKFVSASLVYAAMAIYLYQPYFNRFVFLRFLVPMNVCAAGLGCYVLSRRWVFSFWASLFAGLLYGFGPLMLRINSFHPSAGVMAAAIPWLFCPAVYATKGKWQWLSWCLCTLPFLAIAAFFVVTAYFHLFVMPKQIKLGAMDLLRIFAPTVKINGWPGCVGFYHVAIAPLIIGLAMLLAAKRHGILVILLTGLVLGFSNAFFNVTPIMWVTIPTLGCAIIIGEGIQGLTDAGFSDRKWVLTTAIILAALSILQTALAAKFAAAFSQGAKMYMLGAVVVGTIFFILKAKMRIGWVKMLILCLAMAVDIFFGARYIVDMLF